MKFEEARKKLAEIAKEKYHTIRYEAGVHTSHKGKKTTEQECTVYVAGFGHFYAPTWTGALDNLEQAMGKEPTGDSIKEQSPE